MDLFYPWPAFAESVEKNLYVLLRLRLVEYDVQGQSLFLHSFEMTGRMTVVSVQRKTKLLKPCKKD